VRLVGERDLLPGAHLPPRFSPKPADLEVIAADGSTLRGYSFTGADRPFVVVYFGGNEEIITADSPYAGFGRRFGFDVYAVNYRGFGPSSGMASFAAIYHDSVRVYDAIAARPEVRGRPILVCGYSIGTVAALAVATARPVAGIVLQGAPSSAAEVVPKMRRALPRRVRPWVRLRPTPAVKAWRPQPIELAPQLTAPILSIHGTKDLVIAIQFGHELFDAAGSVKKTWCPVEGAGHVGLWKENGDVAGACLEKFLREVAK
jgi:pimeloyl-ACP methyl ester carboxylesterase